MNNLNKITKALKLFSYGWTVLSIGIFVLAVNSDDAETANNPTELVLKGGEITRTVEIFGKTMNYVRYGDVIVAVVEGELKSASIRVANPENGIEASVMLNLKNEVK
jgi:hypothetical protein